MPPCGPRFDGVTWTRFADEDDVFSGSGHLYACAVVDTPFGLVAVGSDSSGGDSDGAIWILPAG